MSSHADSAASHADGRLTAAPGARRGVAPRARTGYQPPPPAAPPPPPPPPARPPARGGGGAAGAGT
ncbi:hypothetical protein [Frankia sp. AgB32]|uniref:hypothetical protein n=1 Tax=Frankia sp. AgB32 TaxID=631119 RepID=UPI00200DB8EC|nr:hypothetical protein [Frankia sp. AgB32]MCK9896521.1 hypothetical protein [Frankia sp. AgB32]